MKFYKIRHIPTGLFYQPTKGHFSWEKTNLSENGKVYTKKPSLKHINQGYNVIHKIKEYPYKRSEFKRFDSSEWEIIEYVVVEKELWDKLNQSIK